MYRLRAAAGLIDVTLYLTTTYDNIKENSDLIVTLYVTTGCDDRNAQD